MYIFLTPQLTLYIPNGDGRYTSSALPMGSFNIVAHAAGYQTSPVMRVNVADNQTTTFDLGLYPE